MDTVVFPPGYRAGCLPRRYPAGTVCGFFRDAIEIIPQPEWDDLIGEIELSPYVKQILNQGAVGSCATESTTQADMIVRDFVGQEFVLLNPWFIYHTTSGGWDSGSSIDENLKFARKYGIAPESVWPRSKGWRKTPSPDAWDAALDYKIDEFYDITNVDEMGTALLKGFPVVFGWQGHSCVMTELITRHTARYANSWGENWNNDGFGTVRLSTVNWSYGAFAVRSVTEAPPT